MAGNTEQICHQGIVVADDGDKIIVKVVSQSACAACHAKGMCNMTEMSEKSIEVPKSGQRNLKPGDAVTIAMRESLGTTAVLFAYLMPFLIVIIALFFFSYISGSEWIAGLLSLGMLLPYYFGLHLLRHRFKKVFSFEIKD